MLVLVTMLSLQYASLIANKCINSYLKSKYTRVLYKLDIEKGFNHVSWDCPMAILEKWVFLASGENGYSFAFLLFAFQS